MKTKIVKWNGVGAFSRLDLVVVVGAVALLTFWFLVPHVGERGHITRCARNLEWLGDGIQSYANDHSDGLPAACIDLGDTKVAWDTALLPYLHHGSSASNAVERYQILDAVSSRFFCPSDSKSPAAHPRSYAMGERGMTLGWPPSPEDKTGVGLLWNERTVSALLGADLIQNASLQPEILPRLKRSILAAPAETLLLTELVTSNNKMGGSSSTRVWNVHEQRAGFQGNYTNFHFGRFNYLMADGHVELLTGLQTGGIGKGQGGIWTIKTGD